MHTEKHIIFMGTPAFAVASLEALLAASLSVVAVVTAPDKPAGRGKRVQMSPVKEAALRHNIPVLQPPNLKDGDWLQTLESYGADLFVVVAFRMLPEAVWNMPPLGSINLHASLLPAYRGAAPINWAIMNGERETGLTTFRIQREIDTGPLLYQTQVPIAPDTTAGELHDTLMHTGAQLLVDTVQAVLNETAQESPQPAAQNLPLAPKIFPADCKLNWQLPSQQVYDKLRGLSPYPAAYSLYAGKILKILLASPQMDDQTPPETPGTLQVRNKRELWCAAADGWVQLTTLKPEGKPAMDATAFINGYSPQGKRLE